jgi:EAL domain-containing protein (putative c-di-GMP-specific phosphodiesterase class I)
MSNAAQRVLVQPTEPLRVLLVDDEPAVVQAYARVLARDDVVAETALSGEAAIERVTAASFDVIVCDIMMPKMTGIDFLGAVRAHDLDVPVILVTGAPRLQSAIDAVEYGAFRYLTKPVAPEELWKTVIRAGQLHKMAMLKRAALELPGQDRGRLGERAALEVRFSWGLRLMWIAFQPIIGWRGRHVFGYEALLRSDEPLMQNPADMLEAAERLGRLHELGRAVRAKVAASATAPEAAGTKLFVNLHAADLNDEELYSPDAPLSKVAKRVVLEVTERASLYGVRNVVANVARLKALGFQIAVDDLGAGYAGLTSFTQLDPDIAKLDMSLVRDVDTDARRQSIIRSMNKLCEELDILCIAEGVETPAERDTLARLGCYLQQGYLFGKPARGFHTPQL